MPELIPALQGWLTTGSLVGLLTLATRHWLAMRKVGIEERKDDREGWGVLILALQADVASVRRELAASREEHRNCEQEMDALRTQIAELHRALVTLSARYNFPLDGVAHMLPPGHLNGG